MKKQIVKSALAFVLFLSLLGGSIVFFKSKLSDISISINQNQFSEFGSPNYEPLPYQVIGDVPAETKHPLAKKGSKYTLELARLSSRSEALALIRKLKKLGVTAFYTPIQSNSKAIYLIRRGVFDSRKEAKQDLAFLRSRKLESAKIVEL